MAEATVTSKGQVTIPIEIRRALGVSAGDRIVFTKLDNGTTVMRAKRRSILELEGAAKKAVRTKRRVPISEMDIGRG